MVDYFKLRGVLLNYAFDEACMRFSDGRRDTSVVCYIKVPNRRKSDFLTFSYLRKDPTKIRIEGNLRKWWYTTGRAVADLDYYDLYGALQFLAKRIGVDLVDLLQVNIVKIELGGNIVLKKDFELFLPSIQEYPKLELKRYGKSSVYFLGSKYEIILYDKIQEMIDRGAVSSKVGKLLKERIFILRYEIKINSPSGSSYKEKVSSFQNVLDNYDFLVDEWLNCFMKIEFVDLFSNNKKIEFNSLSQKEFIQYIAFLRLKDLDLDFVNILSDKLVRSHKTETRREVRKIMDKFKSYEKRNYFTQISNMVARKAGNMKFRGNV